MPFWPAAAVLRAAAGLPGVLAGFAAHLGLGLRPGQRGKALRHSRGLHKVVGHVDEELEGQAKAVLDQAGGKKNGLGRAEGRVAVADGAVAQIDRVGRGDHGFAGVGNGQRNKVIGAVGQRGGERGGHGAHQPLQIRLGDAGLAPGWRSEFRWGPRPRLTCVATFSACQSSICALLDIESVF